MLSAGDQASRLFAGLLLSQGALAVITGDRACGEVRHICQTTLDQSYKHLESHADEG
jgi:hypothetical protein